MTFENFFYHGLPIRSGLGGGMSYPGGGNVQEGELSEGGKCSSTLLSICVMFRYTTVYSGKIKRGLILRLGLVQLTSQPSSTPNVHVARYMEYHVVHTHRTRLGLLLGYGDLGFRDRIIRL